ncbi:hypothetical protein MTR_4g027375 [Medicago truncatula]|uniref:Uncharacterized protein n=1 Tax=Medicago truncatula TaxID=3880 RepID=A0A072UHM1_MEDTR|nr:hypothetical protein MTR_4g027375 [Medicago truncatula]
MAHVQVNWDVNSSSSRWVFLLNNISFPSYLNKLDHQFPILCQGTTLGTLHNFINKKNKIDDGDKVQLSASRKKFDEFPTIEVWLE